MCFGERNAEGESAVFSPSTLYPPPPEEMHPTKRAQIDHLKRYVARLERQALALDQRSRRFGWARMGIVIGGTALAFFAFQAGGTGWGWASIAVVVLVFGVVARFHGRVEASLKRHLLWRRIKETHIARMMLDWPSLPPAPPFVADAAHPFEIDLNLFGPQSLHHLIDTSSSQGGSTRLRDWLRDPFPDRAQIVTRQSIVQSLAARPLFRDRLALNGTLAREDLETPWDGDRLHAWLVDETQSPETYKPLLRLLGGLALLNIVLLVLHLTTALPALWTVSFMAYLSVYLLNRRRVAHLFDDAYHLEKSLKGFRVVARFLESYRYHPGTPLADLCAPFREAEQQPSVYLKRVTRLAQAASTQKNDVLMVVLNAIGPWDLFFAYRLDQLRETLRDQLPVWLEAWYELEALAALATFADLNPDYTFPTLLSVSDEPIFEAEQLGHPLLPDNQKVSNDFAIGSLGEITLVTGSNMSGKSTFLRTLGVNLSLAYAGAPVDAARCQMIPFRLFTCINVSDSVHDGISYFYAEVRRLKALLISLRAKHDLPLFFLIDEIFRGTNNRERLQGSRSYVRALAGQHGTGLISTHDLELVTLADELPNLHNYHFREEVEEGRMVFDYLLHLGPCPTTNALKIMELEGLPVDNVPVEPQPRPVVE